MGEKSKQPSLKRSVVLQLAQKYLDERQPRGYRMVSRPDRVQKDGATWYVQVDPVPADVSSGDFINRMVEATMDLQEREGIEIELTNMLPRDVAAAETLLPRFASAVVLGKKRAK